LTTHSPAFYDLGQREPAVALNFVMRTTDVEGTVTKSDATGIDESLGTLAMLAPRISEMVLQVREQEAARHEAAILAEQNCARIFVEGESDKLILERALQLFFPEAVEAVSFQTKRAGAGHSYVIDMLSGWRSQHKHHPERPKAVGIVDGDAVAEKNQFNKQPDNIMSAKCFCFPTPAHLRGALAVGFRVPVTLEVLYPRDVWLDANRRRHLDLRDSSKIYPADLTNRIIRGEAQPGDGLNDDWAIFVTHDFNAHQKIATARRLCGASDDACRVTLANFQPILAEALNFLGLAPVG
jgi:hypothetical protein